MKITLLEPSMCCSTGLCGEQVDDVLVATAANIKWLKSLGHEVNRHNISNDSNAFLQFPNAILRLKQEGLDSLPYILINGTIVMSGVYPVKAQWERWIKNEAAYVEAETFSLNKTENGGCCSGSGCC